LLQKPVGKIAFTGDTLFCRGIGRSDLAGGNEAALIKSIKEKLFTLPDDTKIYPGHGASSTIGAERQAGLV
jgi:glyoxylase-like metal-dependent hydrolase (beta-lactamase superfamily II)